MLSEKREVMILFGAGVYAKKYKALLEFLQTDFDYFTDNASSKWGTFLYGKPIIPPKKLQEFCDCKIIISSTHEQAIRQQLEEMGLRHRIIGLDELYGLCEQRMQSEVQVCRGDSLDRTVLIDMYEGIGWGGTELWAARLARGLQKQHQKVILIGGTEQPKLEPEYEDMVVRISEKDTIMRMVELIRSNLPCVFVNNFAGCAFLAAIIVKRQFPDMLKLVSVIHNDNKSLFDAHMMMDKYIDNVFCVSERIRQNMIHLYDFAEEKYFFKEQPIQAEDGWERCGCNKGVLKIGYAARLVKQQKRADLLSKFISCLEERGINYLLQIAGEGECEKDILTYVEERQLQDKVQLLGRIPQSQMPCFWKNQDVFINISEYEGTSLSMLEAMSYGCVPVVTDVSGSREFIQTGKNGYICEVGDLQGMADCVCELEKDREKLSCYAHKCIAEIQKRCNAEDYIKFWIENLIDAV